MEKTGNPFFIDDGKVVPVMGLWLITATWLVRSGSIFLAHREVKRS